jgi:hypothetical protein
MAIQENRYSGLRHHAKVHSFRIFTVVLAWVLIAVAFYEAPELRIYLASDHADRRAVADTSLWDCRLLAFAAKAAMNRCDAYSARQLDPEQELATFRAGPIGSLKELTKAERSHVTPA